jgi:hypothetical protein
MVFAPACREFLTMPQHVQPAQPICDSANRGEALTAALEVWARSQPEQVAALLAQWIDGQQATTRQPS